VFDPQKRHAPSSLAQLVARSAVISIPLCHKAETLS
jgi:hypothetical protein